MPLDRYISPRKAEWPVADFVVGNPPFLGKGESMRSALGDGYLGALRSTWPAAPESADFVMVWWHKAASLTRSGQLERFGFITTNSIKQTFNRRAIETAMAALPPSPPGRGVGGEGLRLRRSGISSSSAPHPTLSRGERAIRWRCRGERALPRKHRRAPR